MKKHVETLKKLNTADLQKKANELRVEIVDLQRGIKTGDVQNLKAAHARKRELARVLTLLAGPQTEEVKPVEKVKKAAKTAVKEKK